MLFKKLSKIHFIFYIFLIILMTSSVKGQDDEEGSQGAGGDEDLDEEPPRSCYKYVVDFSLLTVQTTLKCLGSSPYFKVKTIFEYSSRFYCLLKCVFQELGAITPEGQLDSIAGAFFFEENFDPAIQQTILPLAQSCFGLAEQFVPKEYWCKTYAPFLSCLVQNVLPTFIGYAANCYISPATGILFSVFTNIAPNTFIPEELSELKRLFTPQVKAIKCWDTNCTTRYKMEKKNRTTTIIMYDRNMTEISRHVKLPKNTTGGAGTRLEDIRERYKFKSERYL